MKWNPAVSIAVATFVIASFSRTAEAVPTSQKPAPAGEAKPSKEKTKTPSTKEKSESKAAEKAAEKKAEAPTEPPTPDAALARLKAGNEGFVKGAPQHPHEELALRAKLAEGQKPFATVLSCSDSRVPVELAFDQGFGDVFVVRVAGNVADTDEIGTVEYGVDHLGTPVLVVMGHTKCGAVTAVATKAEVHGHIPKLVDNILPAVDAVKAKMPDADPKALVEPAIRENVFQSISDIITKSSAVRARLKNGKVRIVGGVFHLDDGKVEWLGPHPEEKALIEKGDATPETHDAHAEAAHAEPSNPGAQHGDAPAGQEHGDKDGHATAKPSGHGAPANLAMLFALVAFVATLAGTITGRLTANT